MFGTDDGYPAPPLISKNKRRKQTRYFRHLAQKLGKRIARKRDEIAIQIFRGVV